MNSLISGGGNPLTNAWIKQSTHHEEIASGKHKIPFKENPRYLDKLKGLKSDNSGALDFSNNLHEIDRKNKIDNAIALEKIEARHDALMKHLEERKRNRHHDRGNVVLEEEDSDNNDQNRMLLYAGGVLLLILILK